jgi:peptidylprolyl isomerase domain and WD repeat-containing protein 1
MPEPKMKAEQVAGGGKRPPPEEDEVTSDARQQQSAKKKKRPISDFRDIPTPAHYQVSFMHRSAVTHVITSWKHAYVVTASSDGIVKFWKRTQVVPPEQKPQDQKQSGSTTTTTPCLEFVKSFTAHVGPVGSLVMEEVDADVCVSIGHQDGVIKLYDVSTFDATAMIKTKEPIGSSHAASFFRTGAITKALFLAVASCKKQDGRIFIYSMDDAANLGLVQTIQLHAATITALAYNAPHNAMYTADSNGTLEVWDCSGNSSSGTSESPGNLDSVGGEEQDEDMTSSSISVRVGGPCTAKFNGVTYTSKMDTQLYQLVKNKTHAIAMCVLPRTGTHVFVYGADNRIRIFHHASGTIVVKYDERLSVYDKTFSKYNMDAMDYGKRAATEREMAATSMWSGSIESSSNSLMQRLSLQVDPSGRYLLLPTLLGVKVIDWQRNKLVKIIGKSDASQLRFVSVCLCWGDAKINRQMQLARGAAAQSSAAKEKDKKNASFKPESDALLVALAYQKKRFFVFSHLDPLTETEEAEDGTNADNDPAARRDIWNEPPTADDRLGMRGSEWGGHHQNEALKKVGGTAILRTSMGDIHIKLFSAEVPKTIENFCGHAKSGYYDNVVFHRVIKVSSFIFLPLFVRWRI